MKNRSGKHSGLTRRIVSHAVPAIIVVILIALCFVWFANANRDAVNDRNTSYITSYTEAVVDKVDTRFKGALTEIELVASSIGADMDSGEVTVKTLANIEGHANFDHVRYVDADGVLLTSSGAMLDATGRAYFEHGMQGESGIDFVENSRITNSRMAVFYAPCVRNNKVVGVFLGLFEGETLERDIESLFSNQKASAFLVTRSGETVVLSASSSLERWVNAGNSSDLSNWVNAGYTDEADTQKLIDAYTNGTETTFNYQGSSAETTGCIAPLSTVDWSLVILFPSSAASVLYSQSYAVTCIFGAMLIGILLLYVVICFALQLFYARQDRAAAALDRYLARAQERTSQASVFVDLEEQRYVDVSVTPYCAKRSGTYDELVDGAVRRQDNELSAQEAHVFFREKILDVSYSDEPRILDTVHTLPGGEEKFLRVTFVPVESVGARVTKGFLFINDVSRAKRRDSAMRAQLAESLEQAQEGIAAKNAFLASMSHDLRTPLNAILGYTALAKSNAEDAAAVEDYADKVAVAGSKLLKLMDDALEVSRMDADEQELSQDRIELDALLEDARELVAERFASKQQELVIDASAVRHKAFVADESCLKRVLQRLLGNASKYTLREGRACLTVEELGAHSADTVRLRFTVSDNGIGITKEFLPHVFDTFTREEASTTNTQFGTGLGLSIVKRLVELMDGTISVESVKGKGTTFTIEFEFPVAVDALPGGERPGTADALRGKRILAAEDNAINAEILVELLAQEGASCKVCPNGLEAVKAFEESCEREFDLILMDVMMPVMDGLEAARAIRACGHPRATSVPIIALTANNFKEDQQRSRDAGMNAHLGKPLDMAQLKETAARLCR